MESESENRTSPAVFWIAVAFVLGAWVLTPVFLLPREDHGTFGDMYGAVNALFSGLAFAGIIYTVWLQRKELQLQRRELILTRNELEGQKRQLEAQNETLRKQTFENTFFQLLRLHNDILNTINIPVGRQATARGRDCFEQLWRALRNDLESRTREGGFSSRLELIDDSYQVFYSKYQSDVGHYFRSLYNIMKFIKQSEVSGKRLYTNLVRAQLSSFELVVLFYNCLSKFGREKFKPLVEEFAILKTLDQGLLHDSLNELSLYDNGAYSSAYLRSESKL